jgi:hypothetical protein
MLRLNERLATAVELARDDGQGLLTPLVLAEAATDSRRALDHPLRYPRVGPPLAATTVALLLLAALTAMPSRWLPEVLRTRREHAAMRRAADMLSGTVRRLHQRAPDLPGQVSTQLRFEMADLAGQLARGTLTPEAARRQAGGLENTLSEMDLARRQEDFERDLRMLDEADVLGGVTRAVRRHDTAGAVTAAEKLDRQHLEGRISDAQLRQLAGALERTASTSDRPGLADAATELLNVLEATDERFGTALDRLVRELTDAVEELERREQLRQTVAETMRDVKAILTGKPTGVSSPAEAASALLQHEAPQDDNGSAAPASGSPGPSATTPTLSERTFSADAQQADPAVPVARPAGYDRYLKRYFAPDDN